MTLTRVTAAKAMEWLRHRAESEIEAKAAEVRARFATPTKHAVYQSKLREAERYLAADDAPGPPPNLDGYPYLRAEAGRTAPTARALAELWISMNAQWEQASAAVEEIAIAAKAQARAANSPAAAAAAARAALPVLDAIGTKPPAPPARRPPRAQ